MTHASGASSPMPRRTVGDAGFSNSTYRNDLSEFGFSDLVRSYVPAGRVAISRRQGRDHPPGRRDWRVPRLGRPGGDHRDRARPTSRVGRSAPEEMQALAGAGGSGGARPKANVRRWRTLWLANSRRYTTSSRSNASRLRHSASLEPVVFALRRSELELASTPFPLALIQRFDRRALHVSPISARTALGKTGTELGSYDRDHRLHRGYAAAAEEDFRELFLRLIFTILVSNKDRPSEEPRLPLWERGAGACRRFSTSTRRQTATRISNMRRSSKAACTIDRSASHWRLVEFFEIADRTRAG